MALIIIGLDIAYGSCSSLHLLERSLYNGNSCNENVTHDPNTVAVNAFHDGALDRVSQVGLLSTDPSPLIDSPQSVFGDSTQIGTIPSTPGAIFQSIQLANSWIQENADRVVSLTITSGIGTGSMLLAHPSRNIPAYAQIEFQSDQTVTEQLLNAPIGYLELSKGISNLNQEEFDILGEMFVPGDRFPETALGSIYPRITDESGLASLIHSSLLLSRKIIPESSGVLSKDISSSVEKHPFYIPEQTRPWLDRGNGFQRSAMLIQTGNIAGKRNFLILREPGISKPLPNVRPYLSGNEPILIPLWGNTLQELLGRVQSLEADLQTTTSVKQLAKDVYAKFSSVQKPGLVCSLMGTNQEDFLNEIAHAKKGIPQAFTTGKTWSSPKGSYFTHHPLGKEGVAFVYPGAFNSYPGMGRELFDYFPHLHDQVKKTIQNISYSFAEKLIFPRYLHPDRENQTNGQVHNLYNHPSELIETGISISVLHTLILRNIFNISPKAAFGYSLGEISMLFGNNIWQNAGKSSDKLKSSPLFRTQLFGPMNTVRSFWKDEDLEDEFWASYILKAPVHEVEIALEKESQVFLTIINTPEEVVIAGKIDACKRIISQLACHALPMPFNSAIHNPAIQSSYPDFKYLYTHDVQLRSDMLFYSAAEYKPLSLDTVTLSQSMAKMTCNMVNFPKLVNCLYQDGVRIFIEVGPQKTCSRWIEKILDSQPHAVIPINKKHQSDYVGVLKVLSLLVSHQVPLDLSPLFPVEKKISAEQISGNGKSSAKIESSHEIKWKAAIPQKTKQRIEAHLGKQSVPVTLHDKYLENLTRLSTDAAESHQQFLSTQQTLTRNLARVVQLQTGTPTRDTSPRNKPDPLFAQDQIVEFTRGDHQKCFGSTFSGFEERRIPRLPNGDLRFIDRVIDIQGEAEKVKVGSSLVSEFNLPAQDWYLKSQDTALPHVSLMELALQPCGFLSAFMGSIKNMLTLDLYFRNLDGEGTLLAWPSISGQTITNRVELLSASRLKNVIIQEYSFELSLRGKPFYKGKSSFGYFTQPMLVNQSGLDGNQKNTPWKINNSDSGQWVEINSTPTESSNSELPGLPEINQLWISTEGGEFQKGYLFTKQQIPSNSWFYQAHFFQDPVMPGSLGVETMAQAIIQSAPIWGIPEKRRWRIKPGQKTAWKYRGQITRDVNEITIDLHIKEITPVDQGWQIISDGNLWKGNVRIYQITDLALETY
jgi:PfaB family protein